MILTNCWQGSFQFRLITIRRRKLRRNRSRTAARNKLRVNPECRNPRKQRNHRNGLCSKGFEGFESLKIPTWEWETSTAGHSVTRRKFLPQVQKYVSTRDNRVKNARTSTT